MANSARLARCQRIVDSASFRTRGRQGISVHGRHFRIRAMDSQFRYPRLGLVVSKKVSKKAVQRNRIKRQIREAFRYSQGQLSDMDFVVVANPGISGETNGVLSRELMRLFEISQEKCQSQK